MPSGICSTNLGVNSSHVACSPLCFLLPWDGMWGERKEVLGREGGSPSFLTAHQLPSCCLICLKLLQAGQGWPEEEVSQILAQLQEQVEAVISPSDLLALVATMTVLAKVVADTGTQLNCSALEVRSLNHSRGQLGSMGRKLFPQAFLSL